MAVPNGSISVPNIQPVIGPQAVAPIAQPAQGGLSQLFRNALVAKDVHGAALVIKNMSQSELKNRVEAIKNLLLTVKEPFESEDVKNILEKLLQIVPRELELIFKNSIAAPLVQKFVIDLPESLQIDTFRQHLLQDLLNKSLITGDIPVIAKTLKRIPQGLIKADQVARLTQLFPAAIKAAESSEKLAHCVRVFARMMPKEMEKYLQENIYKTEILKFVKELCVSTSKLLQATGTRLLQRLELSIAVENRDLSACAKVLKNSALKDLWLTGDGKRMIIELIPADLSLNLNELQVFAEKLPQEFEELIKQNEAHLASNALLPGVQRLIQLLHKSKSSDLQAVGKRLALELLNKALVHEDVNGIAAALRVLPRNEITETQVNQAKNLFKSILEAHPEDAQSIFTKLPEVAAEINRVSVDNLAYLGKKKRSNSFIDNFVWVLKRSTNPVFQAIEKRFQQIEKVSKSKEFEQEELPKLEILKKAVYFETNVKEVVRVGQHILKMKDTGLSRTLQYDANSGVVFIHAKIKVSKLSGAGSYKKVVSSIGLPLADYQKTMKAARVFTKVNTSEKTRQETLKEAAVTAQFAGKPGFMKLHTFCDYTFQVKGKGVSVPRVSLIYEASDGDLAKVGKEPELLTLQEKLQVAKDLIYGFDAMHKEGYVHGDIKPANGLFMKKDPDTQKARGAVTDFGFTRKEKSGKPPAQESPPSYREGLYGTPIFTAPELFGVKNFSGDHFKVDAFALGVTLCELRFGKGKPPWLQDVMTTIWNRVTNKIPLAQAQAEVNKKIQAHVEYVVTALQAKQNKTLEDEYDLLAYKLMRLNPANRLDLAQAKLEIDRILPG